MRSSSASPASVSSTRCVVRRSRPQPISFSNELIWRLNADCDMCSRSAAREKLSSSATATNARRWRSSIASPACGKASTLSGRRSIRRLWAASRGDAMRSAQRCLARSDFRTRENAPKMSAMHSPLTAVGRSADLRLWRGGGPGARPLAGGCAARLADARRRRARGPGRNTGRRQALRRAVRRSRRAGVARVLGRGSWSAPSARSTGPPTTRPSWTGTLDASSWPDVIGPPLPRAPSLCAPARTAGLPSSG